MNLPVLAGMASTIVFTLATMPMLIKAVRTRDLSSYSLGNLLLSNTGNAIYSFYIFSLPAGPVWALHAFNTIVSLLMLSGWVRYGRPPGHRPASLKVKQHNRRNRSGVPVS